MQYTRYVIHCQGVLSPRIDGVNINSKVEINIYTINNYKKDQPIINHSDINVKVD